MQRIVLLTLTNTSSHLGLVMHKALHNFPATEKL